MNYANIRMRQEEIKIGESAAMPPDLDASYLKLNLPGSPLPTNGLLAPNNMVAAETNTRYDIVSRTNVFSTIFTSCRINATSCGSASIRI